MVALVTGTTVGGIAGAHSECWVESHSEDHWYGDEHANTCDAGSGGDSMYGYGDGDDLTGGGGDDKLRGATGNDHLREGQSDGDTDLFCDGDGWDNIHMRDSDGADHFHRVVDNHNDPIDWSSGDTWHEGTSAHTDCPM